MKAEEFWDKLSKNYEKQIITDIPKCLKKVINGQ